MPEKNQSTLLSNPPSTVIGGRRFSFVSDRVTAGEPRRRFTQPRPVVVLEEMSSINQLLDEQAPSAMPDRLDVILVPDHGPGEFTDRLNQWLNGNNDPEQSPIITVTTDAGKIRMRDTRAVLQTSDDHIEDLLTAVVEFGFLQAELHGLEERLLPIQTGAPSDVPFAYRIRQSDEDQWDRLGRTMEQLAQLRLTFARLEPLMGSPTPSLPLQARRAMSGLLNKSNMLDRLEAFSDRLEACEDLYEGAFDRITDFRWYRKGNLLEITIVVLLALEAILLGVDHFRH